MNDAVAIRDLVVRYDNFIALEHVDLTVRTGEALGIIGPNGSGKSTLLKTVAGLLVPSGGSVRVLGREPRELQAGSIAYVPQVEAVDWSFPATVWDVVAMSRFSRLKPFQRFGKCDREAVAHAIHLLRIEPLAKRHISALSGGQQQRAFVARAIAQEPKILLLDEPTTGVDQQTEDSLAEVVRELVGSGMPVMMATHELERADAWFDRIAVLDRRLIATGTPREIARSGAYAALRDRAHPHGHLRTDHAAHEGHHLHPETVQ